MTDKASGNVPQYIDHSNDCAWIEARFIPYWAQAGYQKCDCGADEHNAYVDGFNHGRGME